MSPGPADPQPERDAGYMRRALELAARGWGRTWPNPLVGAVVVNGARVVGEGWHEEYGGAHAEVNALAAAGDAARGGTMYVTLEPCAHRGKTPPCTDAVERAGIRRVVYAADDPTGAAGGGGARLRSRGLAVTAGIERAAVREQNRMFFHVQERQTPFVALKYALSLDARLAAEPGRPTAITGETARREAHRLRAGYDAIVVGIGTVLADDPLLTARGDVRPRVAPVRVVLDTEARLPPASRLVTTIAEAPVWCLCAQDVPAARREALAALGVKVLAGGRAADGERLDLDEALTLLWREELRALFVEGGARLGSSLLARDRVEELVLFYGPLLVGAQGLSAFPPSPPAVLARPGGWKLARSARFGDDVLLELHRARSERAVPAGGE